MTPRQKQILKIALCSFNAEIDDAYFEEMDKAIGELEGEEPSTEEVDELIKKLCQ